MPELKERSSFRLAYRGKDGCGLRGSQSSGLQAGGCDFGNFPDLRYDQGWLGGTVRSGGGQHRKVVRGRFLGFGPCSAVGSKPMNCILTRD